jgi:hypothetical protein
MNELSYLILIIPLIYAIMMMAFSLGWLRLPAYQHEYFKSVSIIIAVRNEEDIPHLLDCLHLQSYPACFKLSSLMIILPTILFN